MLRILDGQGAICGATQKGSGVQAAGSMWPVASVFLRDSVTVIGSGGEQEDSVSLAI